MTPLVWSKEPPTEPGWYFLRYKGFKQRVERLQVVELALVPRGHIIPKGTLAYKTWYSEWVYDEIRFHPDCSPVLWAGPIPQPAEVTGAEG